MIRYFVAVLLFATPALAQQPSPAPNAKQQIEQTIGSQFIQIVSLQEQLRQAEAMIAQLQKDLAAAKESASK